MSDRMPRGSGMQGSTFAAVLTLSVFGMATIAEALPLSEVHGPDVIQAVQYGRGDQDLHDPGHRHYAYHGPAGLYDCGRGRVNTYLARKACGGAKFPNRFY